MKKESKKIPTHVAIIMDGNGRWAKKRLLPRAMGHSAGAKNVEPICEAAWDLGVKYLTVYAFSTENWTRMNGMSYGPRCCGSSLTAEKTEN